MKRNGNNIYTIRPIREAVNHYNEQQLQRLDAISEQQRVQTRLPQLYAPQEPLSTSHNTPVCRVCVAAVRHERLRQDTK